MKIYLTLILFFVFSNLPLSSCAKERITQNDLYTERAEEILKAIYTHYSVENSNLLRETYPFNAEHKASYLADEEQAEQANLYSYLWPYSGGLSALTVLCEGSDNRQYSSILEDKILPGLEMYYDTRRSPYAYASYINTAPLSDRFYDDNIWLGIDFTDLYTISRNPEYLEKAKQIWQFIESGTDTILEGGIYWCEQKKTSKNTCSNAPGCVYALKLYQATKEPEFLQQAITLYEWTKEKLQDKNDFLYYDNIKINGRIARTKYPYNSGQMLQASVLLYEITKEEHYLTEAGNIAESCYNYFFDGFQTDEKKSFKVLKNSDVWFIAVMLRGFVELYKADNNNKYIDTFRSNLDFAWKYMRDENGLFNTDWKGQEKNKSKWLLTQFAMVEMYARLSIIN